MFNHKIPKPTRETGTERRKLSKEKIEGGIGTNWELWAGNTRRTGDAGRIKHRLFLTKTV